MFGRSSDSENSTTSSLGDVSGVNGSGDQPYDVSAFVGEGVDFKGIISYKGTVRIDGNLEGEIHTTGVLLVGRGAVINARVEAGTIISQGKIVGNIVAGEKIQLNSPAILNGSVRTPSLSMEEGVLFNGSCEMGPQISDKGKLSKKDSDSKVATMKDENLDENLKVV